MIGLLVGCGNWGNGQYVEVCLSAVSICWYTLIVLAESSEMELAHVGAKGCGGVPVRLPVPCLCDAVTRACTLNAWTGTRACVPHHPVLLAGSHMRDRGKVRLHVAVPQLAVSAAAGTLVRCSCCWHSDGLGLERGRSCHPVHCSAEASGGYQYSACVAQKLQGVIHREAL